MSDEKLLKELELAQDKATLEYFEAHRARERAIERCNRADYNIREAKAAYLRAKLAGSLPPTGD